MNEDSPSTPNSPDQEKLIPDFGPLIGVDYGSKRIGLAISTPDRSICFPLETFQRKSLKYDLDYLLKLIKNYQAVGLIMGLAVHMSGDEGEQAGLARKFGEELASVCHLPIAYVDERFSSLTADKLLYQQQLSTKNHQSRRDAVAAQVLLQTFIEHGSLDVYCPRYDQP